MAGQDWLEKDFYRELGVSKDADQTEIKKAYRKLARKYHPDQNQGNPKAEEKFKSVGEAYQVLSDPEQRKQYDGLRAMAGGGARFSAGSSGAGGFEDLFSGMFGGGNSRVRFSTNSGGFDAGDIFSGLFGGGRDTGFNPSSFGGAPGFGSRTPTQQKGADLRANAKLTLRQAVTGATLKLTVEGRAVKVRVPAGITDGQKLKLSGKGRPGINGGAAGDLLVTVQIAKDPVFRLTDAGLEMRLPVSIQEAVSGATITTQTIDGTNVKVKVPAGTSSGTALRLRGKASAAGGLDLIARIQIVVPSKPSKTYKAAVNALDDDHFNPRTQRE